MPIMLAVVKLRQEDRETEVGRNEVNGTLATYQDLAFLPHIRSPITILFFCGRGGVGFT